MIYCPALDQTLSFVDENSYFILHIVRDATLVRQRGERASPDRRWREKRRQVQLATTVCTLCSFLLFTNLFTSTFVKLNMMHHKKNKRVPMSRPSTYGPLDINSEKIWTVVSEEGPIIYWTMFGLCPELHVWWPAI